MAATLPAPEVLPAETQLHCPMCRYDLRGLTDPRCPECGFKFTWDELIDAKRERHPWLFEHARRPWGRPLRAFCLTAWRAGLRPWKFWSEVSPTNPVKLKRLVLYWAILNLPFLFLILVAIAAQTATAAYQNSIDRAAWTPVVGDPTKVMSKAFGRTDVMPVIDLNRYSPPTFSKQFWSDNWFQVRTMQAELMCGAMFTAFYPWFTAIAIFASFRWSLRRAKIDSRQTIRTAIYCSNVAALVFGLCIVLFGPGPIMRPIYDFERVFLPGNLQFAIPKWLTYGDGGHNPMSYRGYRDPTLENWRVTLPRSAWLGGVPVFALAVPVLAIISTLRLTVAFRRYMQFDLPFLTAVAAQTVVVISAVIILIQLFMLAPPWP